MLDLAHRFAGRAGRTKFLWRQRAAMCQSWLACPARVAVRAQAHPFLCEPPRARIYLATGVGIHIDDIYSYQRVGNSEFRFKPRRLAVTVSQSSPKRSLSDLEKRGRSFDHFLVFGPRERTLNAGARGHVGKIGGCGHGISRTNLKAGTVFCAYWPATNMSNKISAQLHLLYQWKSFWYPNHLARAFARTQRSSLMRLGEHGR